MNNEGEDHMKRMLVFLMVLSMLSSVCFGLAEEEKKSWKEQLAAAADDLIKDIQDAGQEVASALSETAKQASEKIGNALSSVENELDNLSDQATAFLDNAKDTLPEYVEQVSNSAADALGKLSDQAAEVLDNAKDTLPEYVEQVSNSATDALEKISDQAAEALDNAKDTLPGYAEQAKDTATEKLKELSDQVSDILASAKETASVFTEQTKDAVTQMPDKLAEDMSKAAKTMETSLINALNDLQKSAIHMLWGQVNWIKGGTEPETPSTIQNAASSATDEAPTEETPKQPAFFPLPGYGFYFGMTWTEARALQVNYLNDSRANMYARARALVMLNKQKTSLYFLWFAGETDAAYLFEVDEFAFSSQDTLIPPTDANGQYHISTTEATVGQVYADKASTCAQLFGAAINNLESGMLVPSLMFGENDTGISQTQVYLTENTEGVNVVTHFVYTTDCGVNVITYQHMNNTAK